ncbi:MAG: hypothetical protein ACRYFS_23320 [Janthinobacterium lividum]
MLSSFLTPLILRRLALLALLLADVLYAAFAAPKGDPPGNLFVQLALGQGPARNPAIWGVFQLLGVIPLMYWALLFPDGRGQKVWAGPFALGMMALGSFSLLPYLILRRPYPVPVSGARNLAVRWFAGRPFAVLVGLALVALLFTIMVWGNLAEYVVWFRRSNFVHVMTIDLLVLTLLFPTLLRDDMERRGVSEESTLGRIALAVPLLGPAWYLVRRPDERGSANH